jgi:hypothetical protein
MFAESSATADAAARDRRAIVDAMAQAAWCASGEAMPWEVLPPDIRGAWIAYQKAALTELERLLPEIRQFYR